MLVKRDPSLMKDTQMCKSSASKNELYGNKINKELADDMLITITHEMFHMHQHKKYNGTDIATLDFSELSANILEIQCAEYYQKNKLITASYENTNIGGYETYAVPIDRNDIVPDSFHFDQNALKAHGYTLAEFFVYLEEQTGKTLTAWKLVDAYSSNNMSNLRTIMKVFGITSKSDLSKYWKGYLQGIADKLGNRTVVVKSQSSDDQAAMPSYLRKMTLGKNHPSEKITVTQANYSAKLGYVFCPDTDHYSVLVTVQEYIAASGKYKEFKGPASEPAVLKFGSDTSVIDTIFPYSSYYSVGKAGINYTGVDGVHFELKENGTCEEYAYNFKGFTATGRLTDMKDMSAWSAVIETCSPGSFYGYDKYQPYQYVDYWGGNDEKIYLTDKARDETWQGSITGKVQGTVTYSEQPYNNNPDSGMIIATIQIRIDVPLTSAKGETMADRSVMFTGSYTKKADS